MSIVKRFCVIESNPQETLIVMLGYVMDFPHAHWKKAHYNSSMVIVAKNTKIVNNIYT